MDLVNGPSCRLNVAYDSAHDVGEAMLAAYGLRTGSGQGQHAAVGEFLEIIFQCSTRWQWHQVNIGSDQAHSSYAERMQDDEGLVQPTVSFGGGCLRKCCRVTFSQTMVKA